MLHQDCQWRDHNQIILVRLMHGMYVTNNKGMISECSQCIDPRTEVARHYDLVGSYNIFYFKNLISMQNLKI